MRPTGFQHRPVHTVELLYRLRYPGPSKISSRFKFAKSRQEFRQKSERDPEPVQKRWRKEKSLPPAGNLTPSPIRSVRCLFSTLTELPPSLTVHLIINSGIVQSERTERCHVNKGPHRIISHIVYTLQTVTH
jgi:hypothetical protein